MAPDKLLLHALCQRFDQCLGEIGVGGAGLPRRERAGDHAHADQERLFAPDHPRAVERLLIVLRLGKRCARKLLQPRWRRRVAKKTRIEHGVEQKRSSADDAGKPGRCAHDVGEEAKQARIGGEQREELEPGGHAADHAVEGHEREIGFGGAAERVEQRGKKLDQPLARAPAAGRGIAARLPSADRGERRFRVVEAETLQAGSRRRAVLVKAADERRRGARDLGQSLEQGFVMGFDPLEPGKERIAEGIGLGKAAQPRGAIEFSRLGGNDVGLLVFHHLQPVLDAAQEEIGRAQFIRGIGRNPASFGEVIERLDSPPRPELGVAAAGDELLGLGEELDIADAPAPELDVVALHGDGAMPLEGMHPPLHGMDVGDRGEVEILPPDEGRELGQELLACRDIAGRDPCLDQGGALPILAEALVIGEPRLDRERNLRRARIGPEPEIGAVDIAVGGVLLEQTDEIAREPHEES